MSYNDFIWIEKFPNTKYTTFNEIIPKLNYTRCNPNIIQNKEGFDVIVRTVNYKIENDHDYVISSEKKVIHTENILSKYDREWNILSQEIIIDKSERPIYNVYITGLEDMRQCIVDNKKYVTSTCAESSVYGMPETTIFEMNENILTNFKRIEPYYEQTRSKEKNWLPFEQDNKLFVIYKQYPTTIHEINPLHGDYKLHSKNFSYQLAKTFRGSAGPLKYIRSANGILSESHLRSKYIRSANAVPSEYIPGTDGIPYWLYIIHEAFYKTPEGEDKWTYTSRWVLMSSDFKIIAISPRFGILTNGIIGFSVRDSEAYRMKISISDIENVLEKV